MSTEDRSRELGQEVHDWVRNRILDGLVLPGDVITQSEVARELGVSRIPVREAFSKLVEEGLITAELNQRPRVAEFDPTALDSLYGIRIALECQGVNATALNVNDAGIADLRRIFDAMDAAPDRGAWRDRHREFHSQLVSGGGAVLGDLTLSLAARAEPYFRLYGPGEPQESMVGRRDHDAIMAAVAAGENETAVRLHAEHLARTALTVLANMAPSFSPSLIHSALALVIQERTPVAKSN